ncbi:hypothetical protein ACFVRD_04965 [Streptomyces sp. NPDC057908]|uniref:hypothetical protein n=1 Tax=Streptomyces sp. NPDC057908 TaxID=3346276 RepID=UPI0036EC9571
MTGSTRTPGWSAISPNPSGPGVGTSCCRTGGRYVDVTPTLHGRLLLRPVAAFPLRRGFRSSVEQAAAQWNQTPGRILAQDLDELRAEPADHVVKDPDDKAG